MFRMLISIVLFLAFGILTDKTSAQTSPQTPLGNGDKGWCTIILDGVSPPKKCGFSSPGAACSAQISTHYPQGLVIDQGAKITSNTQADCQTFRRAYAIGGETWIGVTGADSECESGFTRVGRVCKKIRDTYCPSGGCNKDQVGKYAGNPIDIITGAKVETFTDYASADGRFVVKRHYNSAPFGADSEGGSTANLNLGPNWMFSFDLIVDLDEDPTGNSDLVILAPEGMSELVSMDQEDDANKYNQSYAGGSGLLYELDAEDGLSASTGAPVKLITATKKDGTIYNFEVDPADLSDTAKLVSVDYPGDYTQDYTYNVEGRLVSITDNFNRTMTITYHETIWERTDPVTGEIDIICDSDGAPDAEGATEYAPCTPRPSEMTRIQSITFPDGSVVEYNYNAIDEFDIEWSVPVRLASASRTNADGSFDQIETYHYEDPRYLYALTGVTDAENIRFASWTYDDYGRANSSSHPNDVNKTTINYHGEEPNSGDFNRTVTNPLGHNAVYTVDGLEGGVEIAAVAELAGDGVESSSKVLDFEGFFAEDRKIVDKEGRENRYFRDFKGRHISIVRAFGLPEESTTTATWHPIYHIPTKVIEDGLTTDVVIDDDTGHILSITQTDTSLQANAARSWEFTYDGPNLETVNGPLAGAGDIRSYTYDGPNLTSFTNEAGHTTVITEHNSVGAPSVFTDANNITTRLTYDGDNRLTRIVEDEGGLNAETVITYNATNQILSVTPPNGASLTFVYDDARRLRTITNAVNETITYTRNAMGGVLNTQMSDDADAITYQLTQVFDQKNRLMSAIGAGSTGSGANAVTEFGYDREDNLTSIIDPRENVWTQAFDGLDRLKSETDPLMATTEYGLSKQTGTQNPLSSVTDARGATTNYIRNGFGEVIREVSFEAGTTNYVRDARGLITQMTDARNIVSKYTYDDMGRLLSVVYPSAPTSNIFYGYDSGPNGKGQLTSVTEEYGVTSYNYNTLGQMTTMTREINGQSYNTAYTYDLAGEVLTTTYPSGRIVTNKRDTAARITDVVLSGGIDADIITDITYLPFGPMTGARFGDGHDLSLTYDSSYRATTLRRQKISTSIMDIDFEYDAAGDILALNDNLDNDRTQRFEYSEVSRLTRAEGIYGDIDYSYNLVGDRETRTRQRVDSNGTMETVVEDYSYDPNTYQLTSVTVGSAAKRYFDYIPSGHVIEDDRREQGGLKYNIRYDARGRMSRVDLTGGRSVGYFYDAEDQRIIKNEVFTGASVHYHYDTQGRLISETAGVNGSVLREYIWLGLSPVAVINTLPAANDNLNCDPDLVNSLTVDLANANSTLVTFQNLHDTNVATLERLEGFIAAREAILPTLTDPNEIAEMEAYIAKQYGWKANLETKITRLEGWISDAEALKVDLTAQLNAAQAECGDAFVTCDPALITLLEDEILDEQRRLNRTSLSITRMQSRITSFERDKDQAIVELNAATDPDIIAGLEALIISYNSAIERNEIEIVSAQESLVVIQARIDELQTQLVDVQEACDTQVFNSTLFYLHTDHLGRPKVATDSDGAVVWDGGLTTPFGQGITTMGALTQKLMFPGQYADEETGYSHNWHRTYDPTLGRYLQADPIGLAGGLNRYAYVGGNPTGWVDPMGLQTRVPDPAPGTPIGPFGEPFVPKSQAPANSRGALNARFVLQDDNTGELFLGFDMQDGWMRKFTFPRRGNMISRLIPNGTLFCPIETGFPERGQNPQPGLRFSPPSKVTPFPNIKMYNDAGQPISPVTGQTIPPQSDLHHYPIDPLGGLRHGQ